MIPRLVRQADVIFKNGSQTQSRAADMQRICIALALSLFAAVSAHAASYLELFNINGAISRVWVDDNYARMSLAPKSKDKHTDGNRKIEMLFDIKQRKMFMIDAKTRSLVQMSENPGALSEHSQLRRANISIERKGRGPKVAGMSTQGYMISANGQLCYTAYTSKDILPYKQVVAYYRAMREMRSHKHETNKLCNAAEAAIDRMDINTYGLPVRMLDKSGKQLFKIKNISKGKSPPENYLKIPVGYKTRSMMGMTKQMQNQP